jgi:hypothetical protein
MPNVWTHILYGEKVSLTSPFAEMDESLMSFFRLGTQGPDPFFYHNFWPWQKKPVTELGLKIHYEKCGPFILDLLQEAKISNDEKVKAYVLGFVTHHLLDRNTHPYIIYKSGNEGNRHQKLEIIIDTLLMKKYHDIETWKTPVYKKIDIGKNMYPPIESMMKKIIKKHFKELEMTMPPNYIAKSYRDMKLALKVLFDPLGWKNKLLKKKVSSFSYQRITCTKDYLNENKTTWYFPTNKEESSVESFYDLLKNAENEGETILTLINLYWNQTDLTIPKQLVDKIGNISYDTGKDCTLPLENKHFEPIID